MPETNLKIGRGQRVQVNHIVNFVKNQAIHYQIVGQSKILPIVPTMIPQHITQKIAELGKIDKEVIRSRGKTSALPTQL